MCFSFNHLHVDQVDDLYVSNYIDRRIFIICMYTNDDSYVGKKKPLKGKYWTIRYQTLTTTPLLSASIDTSCCTDEDSRTSQWERRLNL